MLHTVYCILILLTVLFFSLGWYKITESVGPRGGGVAIAGYQHSNFRAVITMITVYFNPLVESTSKILWQKIRMQHNKTRVHSVQ